MTVSVYPKRVNLARTLPTLESFIKHTPTTLIGVNIDRRSDVPSVSYLQDWAKRRGLMFVVFRNDRAVFARDRSAQLATELMVHESRTGVERNITASHVKGQRMARSSWQ